MDEKIKRPNYVICDGFLLPGAFSHEAFRSAINYKPKPGELYIVTFPKCGTTWMQNIIMLIKRKGKPIVNAKDYLLNTPFIEFTGADALDHMTEPGAIKSHLPFHLMPFSPCAKYIYMVRNPKDCCVSFFHHEKLLPFYNFTDGTFDEFFERFVNGQTDYGDYFDHNLSWYEQKDKPNIYFMTYEDLKNDTRGEVLKIAKFMDADHYATLINNPDILDKILEYSSVSYMKKVINEFFMNTFTGQLGNLDKAPSGIRAYGEYLSRHPKFTIPNEGEFVRKGVVGDWKNYFTADQERRMNERIIEKTKGSDFMNLLNK